MKFSIGNASRRPDQNWSSQESRILKEVKGFHQLAALAWSKETIYPKCEYVAGRPDGQCGVTNFGFGLWLSRLGIVRLEQVFFEEGRIVAADGSLVGDDHTWLRIDGIDDGYAHPDLSMRGDFTGDQFPGIYEPVVIQYVDYFYPDPQTAYGNRIYVPDKISPLSDYDTSRFAGRLDLFMSNVCAAKALG